VRIRTGVVPAALVALALLFAVPAHAQNRIGVIGGVNLSTASFDPSVSTALAEEGFSADSKGKTVEFAAPAKM